MRNSAAMAPNHWNFAGNDLMIDMFPNAWGYTRAEKLGLSGLGESIGTKV
jgi:hypothetical protein